MKRGSSGGKKKPFRGQKDLIEDKTTDPLFVKDGGQYYFYHNDHLGTPQKLTAVNGAVVWSAKYSSFGEAAVEVETVENNLRFAGQYYDYETGLHYNYHRFYDPSLGRYLRADPIGIQKGINHLYVYVQNNPLILIDPNGKRGIYYGKYCGPGTDIEEMPKPIDAVDTACQTHDLCYQANNVKWNIPRSKQCHKRDCDRTFYHELNRLLRTSGLSNKARSYARKARWMFKGSLDEPSEWEKNCCP